MTQEVRTPNAISDLAALEDALPRFQVHSERIAEPFAWTLRRNDQRGHLADLPAQPAVHLQAGAETRRNGIRHRTYELELQVTPSLQN